MLVTTDHFVMLKLRFHSRIVWGQTVSKTLEYASFLGLIFFLALLEKTCFYRRTDVNKIELELKGWSQMIGMLSEITHLRKNFEKSRRYCEVFIGF